MRNKRDSKGNIDLYNDRLMTKVTQRRLEPFISIFSQFIQNYYDFRLHFNIEFHQMGAKIVFLNGDLE